MLLDFRLCNYKSFDDWQGLSWQSAGPSKQKSWPYLALFGANAAGKSNLLECFDHLRALTIATPSTPSPRRKYYAPFALRDRANPSVSELELQARLADGRSFRYGLAFGKKGIAAEWLFVEEQACFVREQQQFELWPSFQEARPLCQQCAPQASFLALLAHYRVAAAYPIQQCLAKIRYLDAIPADRYHPALGRLLNDASRQRLLFKLLEIADLGIEEVQVQRSGDALHPVELLIRQQAYNSKGNPHGGRLLSLLEVGGNGMQQFLYYACAILEACWQGQYLIIDHYAQALHPNLALALIDLFAQQQQGAQLLLATQQIQILQKDLFAPEQVYFAEKQQQGATELYCLADFDNLPDSWLENYLKGRFGALPILRHWPRISKWKLFN